MKKLKQFFSKIGQVLLLVIIFPYIMLIKMVGQTAPSFYHENPRLSSILFAVIIIPMIIFLVTTWLLNLKNPLSDLNTDLENVCYFDYTEPLRPFLTDIPSFDLKRIPKQTNVRMGMKKTECRLMNLKPVILRISDKNYVFRVVERYFILINKVELHRWQINNMTCCVLIYYRQKTKTEIYHITTEAYDDLKDKEKIKLTRKDYSRLGRVNSDIPYCYLEALPQCVASVIHKSQKQ